MNTQPNNILSRRLNPWVAYGAAASFYLYQFILRVAPGILSEDLSRAYKVSTFELGELAGTYYMAYAAMQLPVGFLLDRYGARMLVSLSCLCAALGGIIFSLAADLQFLVVGRFMMGMGAACGFIGTIKLANELFPPQKIARLVAITMVMGTLGASLGGLPLSFLAKKYGWQNAMIAVGIFGILLSVCIAYVLPRSNAIKSAKGLGKQKVNLSARESLKDVFSRPQIWLVGVYGSLLYVPLAVIADLWGVPFLTASYGVPSTKAAGITTFIYYGVAVGSPFMAYLSNRMQSRKVVMYLAASISLLVYSLLLTTCSLSCTAVMGLFFLGGLAFAGQSMVFAVASESLPNHLTGLGLGFINTIVTLSGVIFEPLVGYLLTLASNGQKDLSCLTFESYQIALLPIPICMVLALVVLSFIRESFAKSQP